MKPVNNISDECSRKRTKLMPSIYKKRKNAERIWMKRLQEGLETTKSGRNAQTEARAQQRSHGHVSGRRRR